MFAKFDRPPYINTIKSKDIEVVLICIIHEQVHVWVNYPSKNKENSIENIGETSTLLTEPQKTNLPKPGIMHGGIIIKSN